MIGEGQRERMSDRSRTQRRRHLRPRTGPYAYLRQDRRGRAGRQVGQCGGRPVVGDGVGAIHLIPERQRRRLTQCEELFDRRVEVGCCRGSNRRRVASRMAAGYGGGGTGRRGPRREVSCLEATIRDGRSWDGESERNRMRERPGCGCSDRHGVDTGRGTGRDRQRHRRRAVRGRPRDHRCRRERRRHTRRQPNDGQTERQGGPGRSSGRDRRRRRPAGDGSTRQGERSDREVAVRSRLTRRKSKRCDLRCPVERSIGREVLICVPERAAVRRIDAHCCVVAPSVEPDGLSARSGQNHGFGFHDVQRIGAGAAGIRDRGLHRCRRLAVAESDVSASVHGNRAHPPVIRIGRERGILVHRQRTTGRRGCSPHFEPTRCAHTGHAHAVVDNPGLVITEVAVRVAVHQAIGERVEELCRSELGNTGSAAGTRPLVRGNGYIGFGQARRCVSRSPVDLETE